MTNKLKNKRGFSLVELMVVVAIMGTLASIAIPAFNEYRKSAKKASYRADLSSLHKGWLAFGVELDSFCDRDTDPEQASIAFVGMEPLFSSKLYTDKPERENFIGFSNIDSTCPLNDVTSATGNNVTYGSSPRTALNHTNSSPDDTAKASAISLSEGSSDIPGAQCPLGVTSYEMGVYGQVSGSRFIGFSITNEGIVSETAEAIVATVKGAVCS